MTFSSLVNVTHLFQGLLSSIALAFLMVDGVSVSLGSPKRPSMSPGGGYSCSYSHPLPRTLIPRVQRPAASETNIGVSQPAPLCSCLLYFALGCKKLKVFSFRLQHTLLVSWILVYVLGLLCLFLKLLLLGFLSFLFCFFRFVFLGVSWNLSFEL